MISTVEIRYKNGMLNSSGKFVPGISFDPANSIHQVQNTFLWRCPQNKIRKQTRTRQQIYHPSLTWEIKMLKRTSSAFIIQSDWRVNINLFKSTCKIRVKSPRFSFEGSQIHRKANKSTLKDNFYKKTIKIDWKT